MSQAATPWNSFATLRKPQTARPDIAALQNLISNLENKNRVRPPSRGGLVAVTEEVRRADGLLVEPLATTAEYDTNNRFINLSWQYADVAPPLRKPEEASCRLSFPTYELLDEHQLAWYLWWRHKWSIGQVLPTSASYVLLLAYELLNYTWRPDKLQSLRLLQRLLKDYEDMLSVSHAIRRWTADLAWELGLDDEALVLFEQIDPSTALGARAALTQHKGISLDLVTQWWVTYRYNSRWREANSVALCRLFYEVLCDGKQYFSDQNSSLEDLLGLQLGTVQWKPYNNAIIHRTVYYRLFRVVNFSAALPHFIQFLKRLENLHRQAKGERRQLRVQELPAQIEQFIQDRSHTWPLLVELVNPKSTMVRVEINNQLVETLLTEAAQLRDTAISWLGEDEAEERTKEASTPGPEIVMPPTIPEVMPPGIEQPSEETVTFSLSPLQRLFIEQCRYHQPWSLSAAREWARDQAVLLTTLTDSINSQWVELYDAPLIINQDNNICLDPDFVAELSTLHGSR